MCIRRGALLCASFEVLYFVHLPFWYIPPGGLLGDVGLGDTRGFCFWRKTSPPCQPVFPGDLFEGCFLQGQIPFGKNWSAFVGCRTCPSRSELLSSEVTLVSVVFLGKTAPPFLTSHCQEAVYEIKKGGFFLCGTSIVCLLTRQRAEILYFG